MPISTPSWSSLHSKKSPRHPTPSSVPPKQHKHVSIAPLPPSSSLSAMSNDSIPSSRTSSLAGRKRPRESDGDSKLPRLSRRTKSVGDARDPRSKSRDKDREAFQRGLIAVFVPNALKESLAGNNQHYNELLAHFLSSPSQPPPSLPTLLPLLRGLTAHVSLLSPDHHAALVTAIMSLPWACGEDKFVKIFIGFAGVLVSAQQSWAKEVVSMAIKGLTWQPTKQSLSTVPLSRRIYYARHHLLLAHLLSLIPTLPTVISPLLSKHFPNKREPEIAQTTWVRNCCELIGYCPELGQRVWGQVVDRMLRIDAEINNILEEEEEEDDDETEDEDDGPVAGPSSLLSISYSSDAFDLLVSQDLPRPDNEPSADDDSDSDIDPAELSSADGSDDEDEDTKDERKAAEQREKRKEAVRSMKGKLDGMLFHFFQHLEECMGGVRPIHTPATEMAAFNLVSTASSSGASTPTMEYPNPISSSLPSLAAGRPSPTPAQSLSHFQTLLNLFTRQILPTSSTQHIPFLLFFTSSLTPSHTDLFLGLLVSQALYGTSSTAPGSGPQISLQQRIASTVYIASIVCRARFVTDDQARQVMIYLLAYLDGKMHAAPKIDDPPLFYAVCQAVMLIFCFRWRAFASEKEEGIVGEMELEGESLDGDGKWMRDLDVLQRVITSDLNPLLGCNPTIVSTFAKVAHQTNFAYCFSIIESNQQYQRPVHTPSQISRHSSTSSISTTNLPRQARQSNIDSGLDNYFPFDPYNLPRSKRFVESLYRTWGEVAIESADSDDDDDDDDDEEEEDSMLGDSLLEDKLAIHSIPKMKSGSYSDRRKRILDRDGGLSSSLEGMSISPGISRVVGR